MCSNLTSEKGLRMIFRDIASSIGKAERLRTRLHSWPPINSTGSNKKKRGLAAVMDDEMGFVD
jgi:hypothetical protein